MASMELAGFVFDRVVENCDRDGRTPSAWR